jgi:protein TonB
VTGALAVGAAAAGNCAEPATPTRAKANLVSLFSDKDYPAAALAAREQGLVGFALDVGPDGRVSGCTITRSSGSRSLDETTCGLISSRASFNPARDAGGAPVADHVRGRIDWKLPTAPPATP